MRIERQPASDWKRFQDCVAAQLCTAGDAGRVHLELTPGSSDQPPRGETGAPGAAGNGLRPPGIDLPHYWLYTCGVGPRFTPPRRFAAPATFGIVIELSRWRRVPPSEHPGVRLHGRNAAARRRIARAAVVLALGVAAAAPAAAQPEVRADERWHTRAWMGDVAFLSLNALVGGGTAGLLQTLRDGSFQDGFARGALGGAISYGGRRLSVEDFSGAGLLGRQLSAVGASVVRNASEGAPVLSRLALPLGPVVVVVDRRRRTSVSAEVDATGAGVLIAAFLDDRLELDGGASLSAGAPVFRTPGYRLGSDGYHPTGKMLAGLILLGHGAGSRPGQDILAHEQVHVLQYDFGQEIWGDPLESWIADRIGVPASLRFVRPGVATFVLRGSIVGLFDLSWEDRIWEIEAEYLEHR